MKNTFNEKTPYTITFLRMEDWRALRDFHLGLSEPMNYQGYLKNRNPDDPATWMHLLEKTPFSDIFGLWDNEKLIGITAINYKKIGQGIELAEFTASQIADDYLNKGLSKFLYDARIQHLKSLNFKGLVEAYIEPHREPSFKAAAHNGFIDTGRKYIDGRHIMIPGPTLHEELGLIAPD